MPDRNRISPMWTIRPTNQGLSRLTWVTGFVTTLFIPLLILLVTHGVLRIPLLESQGTVIFLFFIWITSSQAILTLTRLRQVASWKVSTAMLMTLLFIVFVYLVRCRILHGLSLSRIPMKWPPISKRPLCPIGSST